MIAHDKSSSSVPAELPLQRIVWKAKDRIS